MLASYPWITEEKAFFGRAQTDYDFEARDPVAAQASLKSIRAEQASLSKKVLLLFCLLSLSLLLPFVVVVAALF